MNLPKEISRWASLLHLFAPELGLQLGEMIRRADLIVGPLRATDHEGHGEPDGYSGLIRRGTYERLVLSDWLLAEEEPDEFLRRAVMGEHAFLQPRLLERRAKRRSVVLFDSGPEQHGAPRVLQMALLILFARRAEEAKAQFVWGLMQRPGDGLREGVTRSGVQLFLAGRSAHPPLSEQLDRWQERLEMDEWPDDLWIVSGAGCEARPWMQKFALIEEPFLAVQPSLHLRVLQGGRQREVVVPLPPESDCVRVLQRPLTPKKAPKTSTHPPTRISTKDAPVFSLEGAFVAMLLEDGRLAQFSVPRVPPQKAMKGRFLRPPNGARFTHVMPMKRRTFAVSRNGPTIFLHNLPGSPAVVTAFIADSEAPCRIGESGLLPAYWISAAPGRMAAMIPDGFGQLYEALDLPAGAQPAMEIRSVLSGCITQCAVSSDLFVLRVNPEGNLLQVASCRGHALDGYQKWEYPREHTREFSAFLALGPNPYNRAPFLARIYEGGLWKMEWKEGSFASVQAAHPKRRPVGIFTSHSSPCLVAVEGQEILRMEKEVSSPIAEVSAPIVQATVHPASGNIACVLEDGTLRIVSARTGEELLRLSEGDLV